jgi:HEAT repeat protein
MANRRGLVIAPLYDGSFLPALPGGALLVQRLTKCLREQGAYDVKALNTIIDQKQFRQAIRPFFQSEGELFFYFYGHGCLRPPGLGVFATSEATPDDEGVLMTEVISWAQTSPAHEVVLILDCCHAGAASPATRSDFEALSHLAMGEGRAILAGCSANQQGWVMTNEDQLQLGAFSYNILVGLEGKARPRHSTAVRASVLGAYVTDVFRSWDQNPIVQTHETGSRACLITFGFPLEPEATPEPDTEDHAPLVIGIPFRPSKLFEGRTAEIDFLRSMLLDARKPVAVSATVEGLGGIGKTEVVLQLLHDAEIKKEYKTIIWLDGAGPLPPQWEKIARELGIARLPDTAEELVDVVRYELKERRKSLIVLDNAKEWQPISKLVPHDIPLLVTTRTRNFGGSGFTHTELGVLSEEAAAQFLTKIVPQLNNDPALFDLVEVLGGHALALELAGWNMNYMGMTAGEYMERLKKHRPDFPEALQATRAGVTVDGCLALTWNNLRFDTSRTLWRRASLFAPTSAHRELLKVSFVGNEDTRREIIDMMEYSGSLLGNEVGNWLDQDPREFDEAYAELRAFHVLSRVEGSEGERWAMHRLPRDFGRARLQRGEIVMHSMAISQWLRDPTLPLAPEIPHLIAVILDSARHIGEFSSRLGVKSYSREIYSRSHSSAPEIFDSGYLVDFLRDELKDPKALTMLLEGLSDINQDVRVQSIRLLEKIGPINEVLEGLTAALDDPDARVREQAINTLTEYGGEKTRDLLSAVVNGGPPRARLSAVLALGGMGTQAHEVLRVALKNDDSSVRVEAALQLCEQGNNEGIEIIIKALQSTRELSRHLRALGAAREGSAVEPLCGLLSNSSYRLETIRALGQIGDARAYPHLIEFLKQYDDKVRSAAATSIKKLGVPEAPEAIVGALVKDPLPINDEYDYPDNFAKIALALAEENRTQVPTETYLTLLRHPEMSVRTTCVMRLAEARSTVAIPALLNILANSYGQEKLEVIKSLGLIADARGIQTLEKLSEAGKEGDEVQAAAAAALFQLGSRESIKQRLKAPKPRVREHAVTALGETKAQQALPELIGSLKDRNRDVRLAAVKALTAIGDLAALPHLATAAKSDAQKDVRREAFKAEIILGAFTKETSLDKRAYLGELARSSSSEAIKQAAAAAIMLFHQCESDEQDNSCVISTKIEEYFGKDLFVLAVASQMGSETANVNSDLTRIVLQRIEQLKADEADWFWGADARGEQVDQWQKDFIKLLIHIVAKKEIMMPLEEFVKFLKLKNDKNRVSAVIALSAVDGTKSVPFLAEALTDKDSGVRWEIATTLGFIGDARSRSHLAKLASDDSDERVRQAAVESLRESGRQ